MATLKEAASGHQYSQALLAGMSDGYCRELQREDPRGRQKSYMDFGGRWLRGDCVGVSAVPSLLPGQSVSHHMLARALHWCLWCHKTRQLVLTFTVAFFLPTWWEGRPTTPAIGGCVRWCPGEGSRCPCGVWVVLRSRERADLGEKVP